MDLYRFVGVLLGTCLITLVSCQRQNMCQVLTRSEMTYVLTDNQRQELISQGYNFSTDPYNGIYRFFANPNDGSLLISAPKTYSPTGKVPYSLGIQRTYEYNAPVYPFPSFKDNQLPNGIDSAVSIVFDKCNRIWILDNGATSLLQTDPPVIRLFAYSILEQRITFWYSFPKDLTKPEMPLTSVATDVLIDDHRGCSNVMAIVVDSIQNKLYVLDVRRLRSWKVESPTFQNVPKYSNFVYKNNSLFLPGGVYSLSITPPIGKRKIRYLFYNVYAGITIYKVPLSIIYREEIWTKGVSVWRSNNKFASKKSEYGNNLEERFTYINVNKFFQVVGSDESLVGSYCDMDRKAGIYYCTSPKARGILAWDIKKPFNFRLVVRNNELLEYPGILRIVEYVKGETEVVTSTSNIIQILLGLLHPAPNNYAVYSCKTSEILKGDQVRCTSNIFPNCK